MEKDYEFVLICATGRSGSTTLQRIINTIPNTNICGENENAIIHLLEFYKSLKDPKIKNKEYSHFVKNNHKPCWYNHFDMKEMVDNVKKTIIRFLNFDDKNTTIGFKEIRWNADNLHLLKEFKELFPRTKIIFHIRNNVEKQSRSDWWGKNQKESLENLIRHNKVFEDFYMKNDGLD